MLLLLFVNAKSTNNKSVFFSLLSCLNNMHQHGIAKHTDKTATIMKHDHIAYRHVSC